MTSKFPHQSETAHESIKPRSVKINSLFGLTRKVFCRLHARLQYFLALHFQRKLFVIIVRMELSHFVIEEILLVFERLGAADVLNEKVGERRCYQVAVFRR